MADRKKMVRFTEANDIALLKEVISRNPFATKSWADIAISLNINVDSRRVRERTHLLLDQRKKTNVQALTLSGVDEKYGEKETLLDEALELLEEEERARKEILEKANRNEKRCKEIRKRAMENLTPKKHDDDESDETTPPKKKPTRCTSNTVLDYLSEKSEKERKLKEEELKVKREELQLQRERFELEKDERKAKIESDRQQNILMLQLMKELAAKK